MLAAVVGVAWCSFADLVVAAAVVAGSIEDCYRVAVVGSLAAGPQRLLRSGNTAADQRVHFFS